MRHLVLAAVAALGLVSFGAAAQTSAPAAPQPALQKVATDAAGRPLSYPLVGQRVPAFSAELIGGGTLTNATLRGKWTVIEFWGIWCPDCIVDAPHVEAFSRAVAADPGLQFFTVHVDRRSGRWPSVAAYAKEKGITYPIALDPDRTLYRAFQLQWVPTYIVIDPQGVVRGYRTDLSNDASGEGGVKAFVQDIAALRREHRRR